jgi:hypothetical protein
MKKLRDSEWSQTTKVLVAIPTAIMLVLIIFAPGLIVYGNHFNDAPDVDWSGPLMGFLGMLLFR